MADSNPAVANPSFPRALSQEQPATQTPTATTTPPPGASRLSSSQAAGSAISGLDAFYWYTLPVLLLLVVIIQPERKLHGSGLGSRQGLLGNLHYQPVKALASCKLFLLL